MHAQLWGQHWDLVICDEAHALKNPTTKRTRAILGERGIVHHADHVWLLSGTPAPNHPGELYPALATLHPAATQGMDYHTWLNHYCYTVAGPYGPRVMSNKPAIADLRPLLADFILRRHKADVLQDLPPLRIGRLTIENEDARDAMAASLSETVVEDEMATLEALVSDDADLDDDTLATIEDLPLSTLRRLCGEAKAHALLPVVRDELAAGGKTVLMCWHRSTMDILQKGLADLGPVRIDGATRDPQAQVDAFQNTTDCRVFLGQILAAGTGHTLTASSNLLIVEPSWVPGENAQAILRIHRLSQRAACLARFVALADSLDEIIMRVAQRKAENTAELFVENADSL